jgi:hypothetical protein
MYSLPYNYESTYKHEEEIREKSVLVIKSNQALQEHLDFIYESLNAIYTLSIVYECRNDDEQTIQFLGIRIFNSVIASIKLFFSGYYQVAFMVIRDILETGFLLDFFTIDKAEILHWKKCSSSERRKVFNPAAIRKALDNRSGSNGGKRKEMYQMYCEYATHPTYQGTKLISLDGLVQIGPFMDEDTLGAIIHELAIQLVYAVLEFAKHFEALPGDVLMTIVEYTKKGITWIENYFKIDLSDIRASLT